MMIAVILAAGFGRRMMPLTAGSHKTLLCVGNSSILSRIVDAVVAQGITEFIIVTGYRADDLHSYMDSNYPQLKIRWVHNDQFETTNNIHSLALALKHSAANDILLIECDLIFDAGILHGLISSPFPAVALVSKYEIGMDGTVVTVRNGLVTEIHPPHLQGDRFDFSDKFKTLNIYKFSGSFVETSLRPVTSFYSECINNNCYYELVLGIMIYMQSAQVNAEIVPTASWSEVDDPVDLHVAAFKFDPGERLNILNRTKGAYWNHSLLDFCFLRNPYFPSDSMISLLRDNLEVLLLNYGSSQPCLDEKLSYFLECSPENVVLLNGCSQIFPWLKQRYRDHNVLVPSPTFGEYQRAFPQSSCYDDKVGIDLSSVRQKLVDHDVIVFVNPNNPTGSIVETDGIWQLAQSHSDKLFIIDESFIDFSNQSSIIDLLKTNSGTSNVLVVKSLSKSLGVPGLRLGLAYSNDVNLLHDLRASLPIWNVNSLAEYFLELLLKNRIQLQASFQSVKESRIRLEQALRLIPGILEVYPSSANFLLVRVERRLPDLVQALLDECGIYAKNVSERFGSDEQLVRFAVRTFEENDVLIAALSSVISNSAHVAAACI